MNLAEFEEMLKNAEDRVSVLADKENINNCEHMTFGNLKALMDKYLTDTEKLEILRLEHFKNNETIRNFVIKSLKTDEAKVKAIQDKELLGLYKDKEYIIVDVLESVSEETRAKLIVENAESLNGVLGSFRLKRIIGDLDGNSIKQIVTNKELVSNLGFTNFNLSEIICKLPDDNLKLELATEYEFSASEIGEVVKSVNDKLKVDVLKCGEYNFSNYVVKSIITSMSAEKIMDVISHEKDLLDKYSIAAHDVVGLVSDEKQIQIVQNLNSLGLEIGDQRKCVAVLSDNAKSEIDKEILPEEVKDAFFVTKDKNGNIVVDFSGDLERYTGLDELIKINPLTLTSDERQKFKELADICPNMCIADNLVISNSTAQEYLNAEAWIEEIEKGIQPEWSDVEKIAYIDNAIGKKVSYTPDFGTEVCDNGAARSLWKIIDSGYGVCNGISQVEQYMLGRIGIESEMISGKQHAFLKIPNLEVKCANGEVKTGSSILDPTWNLAEQRYGAKPANFLRSYDEIRKHDVRRDGTDAECHRNDEKLSDAKLDVDDATLRQIYANIGVITREDNKFPITDMMEASEEIDNLKLDSKTSIKKQFELLEKMHPDFATCPNSTDTILKGVLLAGESLEYNRMLIDRVCDKNDETKKAVQYVYMELPGQEKVFFYADAEQNRFQEASVESFEEKFRCYESDLQKTNGKSPWRVEQEKQEDLTRSSGNIVASREKEEEEQVI